MQSAHIDWLKIARLVLISREIDRLEVEELTPQGKIKYQFSAGGHELAQTLLAQALDHPHDGVTLYYRSRPFMLASGLTPEEALAAGMARAHSPSEGLDVGVMFNMPARHGPTVLPTSGAVGAQYTPAIGWAQAIFYRQHILSESGWSGAIAVAMGGDASTAANGFWSALNIAATMRLPILFFIEDNQFGISVPVEYQTPGGNISENLSSFTNLNIMDGDGANPGQAWAIISEAVRLVRNGQGPCLLHLQVPRLSGHTFIDDQSYKSPERLADEARRDPLKQLHSFLLERGLSDRDWQQLIEEAQEQAAAARMQAEEYPDPETSLATRHLFYTGIAPLQGGLRAEDAMPPLGEQTPKPAGARMNFVDAVRRTLVNEMEINPRLVVFGEDVGVKGGVHGATLDMQAHFGPHRVFDTSLSEEGIIGRSVGMAIAGLLPVPEIQFRKYADPAHEQISDLGTVRWRTANKFAAPVVVRMPVGFGKKTGDPWHSVSGEAIFAHLPGWRIAYPSNAEDAVGLLRTALRGDDPTFFLEHRALLDTSAGRRPYPGDDYCLPFGKAARLTDGDEISIITWGAMAPRCLQAAAPFTGRIQVIDLRTIVPWDRETVLESVRKTGKVLVVHEDTITTGFGAEIIAVIANQAFSYLDAPIERLATPDIPIPYNIRLMDSILPGIERIQDKIKALLSF